MNKEELHKANDAEDKAKTLLQTLANACGAELEDEKMAVICIAAEIQAYHEAMSREDRTELQSLKQANAGLVKALKLAWHEINTPGNLTPRTHLAERITKLLTEQEEQPQADDAEKYWDSCVEEYWDKKFREEIQSLKQANAELVADLKGKCVAFFQWWWNQPGTNTEQGFDQWIEYELSKHDKQ